MISPRQRNILTYISRDLDAVIAPELSSPRAKFCLAAIKTLLEDIASFVEEAAPVDGATLADLVARAMEGRPDAAGQRDAAYRQSGSGVREDGIQEAGGRPIEADTLLAYFKARGDHDWVNSADVVQAPGGFSKETYLVELEGEGRHADIVLRRDPLFSSLRSSVTEEFSVLKALQGLNLPIPHALWVEADPSLLGAAVLAVDRRQGSADVQRWSQDPTMARDVVTAAAQLLARLHQPDVLDICAPKSTVPGATGDTPRAMVDDLRTFWRGLGYRQEVLVEAVFDWLETHAPTAFARRAILHGDFGFHNLLVHEGRITALLDWEYTHVGDVAEDLAYARPFVEQVVPWDEFERLYGAAGGASVSSETIDFWRVFGTFRIGIGCYSILHEVDAGNPVIDAKSAYIGQNFHQSFILDAAQTALSCSAAGAVPAEKGHHA